MNSELQSYIIGLDLGTSAVKLVLLDPKGGIAASSRREYASIETKGNRVEQRTADWIDAIGKAADDLLLAAGQDVMKRVAAIGLSAQMPTMVIMDKKGRIYKNAVVWSDCRAQETGAKLLQSIGKTRHYERTGVVLDGHYILPMYLYTKETDKALPPDHLVMSAKDYIGYYLTGALATDPSTASGYGVYSLRENRWDAEFCRMAGVSETLFPRILDSNAICGRLTREAALVLNLSAGIPVITGGADSVSGVFGLGVEQGTVCEIWGSSTAILGMTDRVVLSPDRSFFTTPLLLKNTYAVEADLMSTGVSYAWAERLIQYTGEGKGLIELASQVPPGSEGVLFYPYLAGGEQGVLWDERLSGAILGLTVNHSLPHMLRAVLEGMCYESLRCISAFEAGGCLCSSILCTGAVTGDAFFMQLLADISGRTCRAAREASGSALGAGLIAGASIGAWSLDDLSRITKGNGREYYPRQETRALYEQGYLRYLQHTKNARID